MMKNKAGKKVWSQRLLHMTLGLDVSFPLGLWKTFVVVSS